MVAPRRTAAEREREAREQAQRQARLSIRLGVAGLAVLFLSGLGVWLWTAFVLAFLAGMVVGILLILGAFLLVRGSVLTFKGEEDNKIF